MADRNETSHLSGTCMMKTAKAAQVDLGDGEVAWFPLSVCQELDYYDVGDDAEFDCPNWLLYEKDLDHLVED